LSAPDKQGDYAYLLHIVASLKSSGIGVCVLPTAFSSGEL
jgi:type I restriction enzyme M protein